MSMAIKVPLRPKPALHDEKKKITELIELVKLWILQKSYCIVINWTEVDLPSQKNYILCTRIAIAIE